MNFTLSRVHLLVFLLFFLPYSYFYNGGGGNQVARFNQTRAIAVRGTLYSEGLGFISDDQLQVGGHTYSNKAPGTSLLGVIPFALVNAPLWGLGFRGVVWQNLGVHLTTVLTVGLPAALMCLVLFVWLCRLGVPPPNALAGAMATGFGTIYFPYSTMYFGHSLAAALAFIAFYLLWDAGQRRAAGQEEGSRVLWAALLVGFSVVSEYPAAICAVFLTLYLVLTRPDRRALGLWAIGGGSMVLLLLGYNLLAFGHPFQLSYLNYGTGANDAFPEITQGFSGVTFPQLSILKEILIGETRGLLRFSPVVVLFVPALVWVAVRRPAFRRELLVCGLIVVAFLTFNAGYGNSIRYWGGANSAGPRHLIPMLPFAGLIIGLLLERWIFIWAPLVAISGALGLMVTAVMPQVPMLYSSPIGQFVVPYFLSGRLALHRGGMVGRRLVTEDSIAYNIGKLVGIPGSYALVPLLLLIFGLLLILHLEFYRDSAGAAGRPIVPAILACLPYGLVLGALVLMPLYHQALQAQPDPNHRIRGTYFPDQKCEGRPIWTGMEPDFQIDYNRDRIRPYPSAFCGRWESVLKVEEAGEYTFRTALNSPMFWLNDSPVDITAGKSRATEIRMQLNVGMYRIRLEGVVPLVSNQAKLSYRLGRGRYRDIPAALLSLPESPSVIE